MTVPEIDLAAVGLTGAGVSWGIHVRDVVDRRCVVALNDDAVLATASVGKLLLLLETARQIDAGEVSSDEMLTRLPQDQVADSGLWQHLQVQALPLGDVAGLVAAVSDNLATNVLLRRVGLDAVSATAARLGLTVTALHDKVRDVRGPEHPAALSSGSAAELATLFAGVVTGSALSPDVSSRVLTWLSTGVDLSMTASAYGLDPLAHVVPDRGLVVVNKTGTNTGVRCDVGTMSVDGRTLAFAVLANWDDARSDERDAVLLAMRQVGREMLRYLTAP